MELADFLPLPELEDCQRLLCVQPHPDDNEIGAGATIAKLVRSGCPVTFLTVTDGSMGTLNPGMKPEQIAFLRRQEAMAGAGILGVNSTVFLNIRDGSYPGEKELAGQIVAVLRDVEPDFVMTVDPFLPYEAHPDHRKVGLAVLEACLFSIFPHFPTKDEPAPAKQWDVKGIALYHTAYPNTFVNADETWDLKWASIAAHQSQFSREDLIKYKQYFEFKARQLAHGRGYTYAEAFKVLTPLHLHANVDAIRC